MDDIILKETLAAFDVEFVDKPELLERVKEQARVQFERFKQCWKLENLMSSSKPARIKASFIFGSSKKQCRNCIYLPYCEQIEKDMMGDQGKEVSV